jgi:pSer/pThr/pTyr-binding forkhead associated (FHA) protein
MADKNNKFIYGILKTQKEVYKLTRERISIGRNRTSNIVINNNTVSKEHAIIEFDEDYNAIIKDLNSSNGTYVNGERLKFMPVRLKTGDKITFGKENVEYIFESFNMISDSKTEADMNEYNVNGINNENKAIYDQKINLVNENELSFARMNHFQNNSNTINRNNDNYYNGSYNNNLKNGLNREYRNEEDNNNNINSINNNNNNNINTNINNDYYNMELTLKNKIDDLEKKNSELENEKENLIKKNNEINEELNKKESELKKMTTLFDELNEEYSKLNSKHNELIGYASGVQKKLDLANIELSQIKKKCHGNEETDKLINEKDNIVSILQNEVNYYKKLCGKNNNNFSTFSTLDINNNYNINQKLDSLIEKYISENKKLKQQNETFKRKIKILQKKELNYKKYNNIDFAQFEIQMNYQIDNFNNIINEYNKRLSDSLFYLN